MLVIGAFFWHPAIKRSGSKVSKAEEPEKDMALTNDPCHLSALSRNTLIIQCFSHFGASHLEKTFFKIKSFVSREKNGK